MAGPHIMPAAPKRTKGPHPAAVGPSRRVWQMQEMQRKMMEMQNELLTLRTVVAQEQVKDDLTRDRQIAESSDSGGEAGADQHHQHAPAYGHGENHHHHPEASPQGQEAEEDIEIPLDELDTHTCKLQAYVRSVTGAKQLT